jgi:tetratricopeptide (TPR) repeat protein
MTKARRGFLPQCLISALMALVLSLTALGCEENAKVLPQLFCLKGTFYAEYGYYDEAMAAYNRALELDPKSVQEES